MTKSNAFLLIFLLLFVIIVWKYRSCPSSASIPSTSYPLSTDFNCQRSLAESEDFFCEPDAMWNERKQVYLKQDQENLVTRPNTFYFANNWHANFHCAHAQRIGAFGDGGKWICDLYRLKSRSDCLVYSVGSSGDFAFEIELKKVMPHCEIHTFDKNPYPCPTGTCTFHQILFGNGSHFINTSKSWTEVVQELNHAQRLIDILKIDIEGDEYSFFPLIFQSNPKTWPRQILMESHPTNVTLIHRLFGLIRSHDYVIFSKENNVEGGPYFFEFGFLKMNRKFFNTLPSTTILQNLTTG